MKKVKITVKKIAVHKDLIKEYENPIKNACNLAEGQVFIANGWQSRKRYAIALGKLCRPL